MKRILLSLTVLLALTASADNTRLITDSSRRIKFIDAPLPKALINITPAGVVTIGYTHKELEKMLKTKNDITGFDSQQAYVYLALEIVRLREACSHSVAAK